MSKRRNSKNDISYTRTVFGLSKSKEREWNDLQDAFAKKGWQLMLFMEKDLEQAHWGLFVDEKGYEYSVDEKSIGLAKEVFDDLRNLSYEGNKELKIVYLPQVRLNALNWQKLKAAFQVKGLYIPIEDVKHFPIEILETWINYFYFLYTDGFYIKTLRQAKEIANKLNRQKPNYGIAFLWKYLENLTKVLKKLKKENKQFIKLLNKVFTFDYSVGEFEQYLPSEQVWALIQYEFLKRYFEKGSEQQLNQMETKIWPEAKSFWLNFKFAIQLNLKHHFRVPDKLRKQSHKKEHYFSSENLLKEFFLLFEKDKKYIRVQELLDNTARNNLLKFLPENVVNKVGLGIRQKYGKSLRDRFRRKLNNLQEKQSIVSRIRIDGEQKTSNEKLRFSNLPTDWIAEKGDKWYHLSTMEIELLAKAIRDHVTTAYDVNLLNETVNKRQNLLLCQLLNNCTSPILNWFRKDGLVFPSWSYVPDNQTYGLRKKYERKRKAFEEEESRLKRELTKLDELTVASHIENWQKKHSGFSFSVFQDRWNHRVKEALRVAKSREAFRLQRMIEFEILKQGEFADHYHNLWLDELLQIEREVSPYLAFVKSAFKMALPARRSVEFDPYRHGWDGIEFDPQTVYDRRKWMKGDLMKMLRTKVSRANAEQINTFVLDYSGSMKGDRMRNLFKLIYLLVLGLESRRTYDSYHFFGSHFMEGTDYNPNGFTDRSVLYRILRKLAKMDRSKIIYSGAGGTNISAGVEESHNRLTEFANVMRQKNPDTFYFTSIFVITDGVPSVGIRDEVELGKFIAMKRADGDVAIKGLYLQPEGDTDFEFMEEVFGKDNYVVTSDFAKAINQLVYITSSTYKLQRKELKYAKKRVDKHR